MGYTNRNNLTADEENSRLSLEEQPSNNSIVIRGAGLGDIVIESGGQRLIVGEYVVGAGSGGGGGGGIANLMPDPDLVDDEDDDYFYFGWPGNGDDWVVRRITRATGDGQSATIINNTAYLTLAAAWAVRGSLSYSNAPVTYPGVGDPSPAADLPQYLQSTLEALTFSVDPSDGGAVVGPFSQTFTTMVEVADALNGETNFRYLQDILDALPARIRHLVTFNLAAGVHTPNPSNIPDLGAPSQSFGVLFPRSLQIEEEGAFLVVGSTDGSEVLDIGTVQSHTNLDRLTDTMPSVTFSGTPFAGQNYVGLYVELSDGDTVLINSHTSNTLVLQGAPATEPTDSSTTARIIRPATIFRNSNDDTTAAGNVAAIGFASQCDTNFNYIWVSDLLIESAGATAFNHGDIFDGAFKTNLSLNRVLSDYDIDIATGTTPNNFYFAGYSKEGYLQMIDCAHRAFPNGGLSNTNRRCDGVALYGTGVLYQFIRSMIIGMEDAVQILDVSQLVFTASTIEDVGATGNDDRCAMLFQGKGGTVSFLTYSFPAWSGHKNEIRDCDSDAIRLEQNGIIDGSTFDLTFTNIGESCLWVSGDNNRVDATNATDASQGGLRDGGGNGGWGVLVEGVFNNLRLGPDTDVEGTSGHASINGVTYATPAALTAAAPVSDGTGFNYVDNT